jgi:hypothetical protein
LSIAISDRFAGRMTGRRRHEQGYNYIGRGGAIQGRNQKNPTIYGRYMM